MTRRHPLTPVALAGCLVASLVLGPGAVASPVTHRDTAPPPRAARPPTVPELPLGPEGLAQTVTSRQIAPGVTWTRVVRGAVDAETRWVIQLSIPAGPTDPDPDAPAKAVQPRPAADALVDDLAAAGFAARAEPVRQPRVADVAAGVIGYRVRLTEEFATSEATDTRLAELGAAGFTGSAWYAGWDGGSEDAGRWSLEILTIDPRRFDGTLGATYGPDIVARETVTDLAQQAGALAAVNAGFFVFSPSAGAPGDPAGAGVFDGRLVSEPVGERPVMVLTPHARNRVERPEWKASVTLRARGGMVTTLPLDGIDRVPGLIRNCGGDRSDSPTSVPVHDVTCTDDSEVVLFDATYGPTTPSGPGSEVVLDERGVVTGVHAARGRALAPGERSLQATGGLAAVSQYLEVGDRVTASTSLVGRKGSLVRRGTSVVNGGPELVRNGRVHITQDADGMHHADDPSFDYGWALQRNPRTFGGIDAEGRTVLVVADGRQLDELGLSIPETAAVARALGLQDALNFDGGGSTAMAVDGRLVSDPSDAAGERPVGDAIVIR